jgi:hypothetical protein
MIGFGATSVTISINYNQYSAIPDLHNLQFTVAHAQGFSVFTSRLLATDVNKVYIIVSLNYTLPISIYYSTRNVTH